MANNNKPKANITYIQRLTFPIWTIISTVSTALVGWFNTRRAVPAAASAAMKQAKTSRGTERDIETAAQRIGVLSAAWFYCRTRITAVLCDVAVCFFFLRSASKFGFWFLDFCFRNSSLFVLFFALFRLGAVVASWRRRIM